MSAWALVHGATQLLIANIVERDRGEDLGERLPERAVGLFVRGLCADAACGDVVPLGPAPSRRRHTHGWPCCDTVVVPKPGREVTSLFGGPARRVAALAIVTPNSAANDSDRFKMGDQPQEDCAMTKAFLAIAAAALAASASPALAKGCLKGAAVGAVGGHMVGKGHAVAGAAAGCAIGHHHAAKKASQR